MVAKWSLCIEPDPGDSCRDTEDQLNAGQFVLVGQLDPRERSPGAIRGLKTNSSLASLALQGNYIGGKGVQALSEALKANSALITMNLEFNLIGDEGAQELGEALKTNKIAIYTA
ncbi:hypothetical protein FBU30_001882 [Linnemannia zychae]|nr:hypothetical protein FBU30_001882 [Linnemannia zychae]